MAINVASIQRLSEIVTHSQQFDFGSISPQEWQQLINSQSIANIDFLKNILEDLSKKSAESAYLEKVQQLSAQNPPLFTPNKISQTNKMPIIQSQESSALQSYQDDLIERLTEIRLKNHLYQHATNLDLDNMLGSLAPEQKQEKMNEFEFWRKVQVAKSHSGEKRFELLNKVLDEAPDSLKSDVKEFKQQLYQAERLEKNDTKKQKKRLEDNSQEIIQKMIEFRDEKNTWFNLYLQELLEETKKPKNKTSGFEYFMRLSQDIETYASAPETPHNRLKLIELSQKFAGEAETFYKDPMKYVDPDNSLSNVERYTRIIEMIDTLRKRGEILALDDEKYAIQKTKENIALLETQKLTADPEQQSIIQANIEIQKKELSYLPIKQATREHLNPYIQIFNEFGKQPMESDLNSVPIQMNEANREDFKRALLCFAEMGEDGRFKPNTNPNVTNYYTKVPDFPEPILELEKTARKELSLDSRVVDAGFQAEVEKSRENIKELKQALKTEKTEEATSSQSLTTDSSSQPSKTDSQTKSPQPLPPQVAASRDLINQMNTKPSPAQSLTAKIKDAEKKGPEPTNAPSPKP
jgi:hypothetical protein